MADGNKKKPILGKRPWGIDFSASPFMRNSLQLSLPLLPESRALLYRIQFLIEKEYSLSERFPFYCAKDWEQIWEKITRRMQWKSDPSIAGTCQTVSIALAKYLGLPSHHLLRAWVRKMCEHKSLSSFPLLWSLGAIKLRNRISDQNGLQISSKKWRTQ